MLGLFRDKKIQIVFVIFVFLMLNWFVVSPIYGLPSTTCNSSIYHTYACDGNSRYYCVRSTTTTSSGTSTRYYWTTSACASGQVCSGGSCVDCTSTSYPNSCSGGVAYWCAGGSKTSVTCTYGSCNGTSCSPGCVSSGTRYSTGALICASMSQVDQCSSSGTWNRYNDCFYGCSGSSCNPYVCTDGAYSCSGGNRTHCTSNSWHVETTCTNAFCWQGTCYCSTGYNKLNTTSCDSNCWCGAAAAGTSYDRAPTSNLCLAGNNYGASLYMNPAGVFYWQWVCDDSSICSTTNYCAAPATGGWAVKCYKDSDCGTCTRCINDGAWNSYCESSRYYNSGTNGVCGGANGTSVCEWSNLGTLCSAGNSAATDSTGGDGGFNWNCNGVQASNCAAAVASPGCSATNLPTVNGQCSSSDGACWAGSVSDSGATTTKSDGIYSIWNCNGLCGGSNTGCEYKLCNRVNGSCSSSDGVCLAGTVSDSGATTTKSDGIYSLWNCNGSCTGSNTSCEYKLCNRVDGSCGTATSGSTCTPPTANFCATTYGNTAITTNSNTFTWKCNGTCSGVQSPTCTSTRLIINGQCGTANGGNYTSTPAANLCAANNVNTPVQLSGTAYSWTCNRNCNGLTVPCSAVYDTTPNFSTAVLKNTSGTVIIVEAGGRNQSCDATFAGSKTNVWTITASDANGLADIKQITLRFRSATNTYSYGPTTAVSGAVTFTVDTTSFTVGTYNAEVLIEDQHTPDPPNRGWLDTGRDFKIWDCQVTVDGTIYDNSDNLACVNGSNQGFSNPIPADIQIFTLAYGDKTPGGSTRNMTVVSPKFYSPQTLTWQNQYFLDTINTTNISFLGLFNRSKINDICTTYNDYLYPKVYVDAYSASPKIDIKYSAVMDQEAWFRVKDGNALADVEVKNYVPVTCNNCATTLNGLVWSKKVNLSDSDESLTSEVQPQPPFKDSYEVLKYDINGGLNVGTTINGSVDWSDIGSTRGVIFVSGNLTIDENVVPGVNDYVFFIVKGKITITENVTQVTGMFFADGLIQVSGQNATQLNITGSLYSKTGITLDRTFNPKRDNNSKPAVEVTFDPNLIFRLPKKLWELYENWTLE